MGLVLVATGLGMLQVVLDKGQRDDWFASTFITIFSIVSACALVTFVFWEWKQKHPIVELHLFKNPSFAVAAPLMAIVFASLLGCTVLLPEFVQTQMGYSAEKAGEVLSPGGFAILLFMPLVGFLVSRVDARYLIALGLGIISASIFYMTHVYLGVDYRTLMMWRVYQAIGMAFIFVPVNTISYNDMPREASNQISALMNLMRNVGGSVGISAVTTLLARRQQLHQNYLVQHLFQYNPRLQQALSQLSGHFQERADAIHAQQQAYGQIFRSVGRQASVLAYIDVFWILGGFSVLAIVFVLFAKKTKPGQVAAGH